MNNNNKYDHVIYIHSLWRSGSTYFFDVFRKSPAGYFCYQEPLHEFVLKSDRNPDDLLLLDEGLSKILFHPVLDKPYYEEVYRAHASWTGKITKEIIYDEYFTSVLSENLKSYIVALIDGAQGRPVIQECRTSNRIGAIKNAIGGTHIYIWRNAWDQWWSFKINEYFDVSSQIIVNADVHPRVIDLLKSDIGFVDFHDRSYESEYSHFQLNRLDAEGSYLLFFTLWCLGWLHARDNADVIINMDMLSEQDAYRRDISKHLEDRDVGGVDVSKCNLPHAKFGANDLTFFAPLEDRVYGYLAAGGIPFDKIMHLKAEKLAYLPVAQRELLASPDADHSPLMGRMREIVLRKENEIHAISQSLRLSSALERDALQQRLTNLGNDIAALTAEKEAVEGEAGNLRHSLAEMHGRLADEVTKNERYQSRIDHILAESQSKLDLERRLHSRNMQDLHNAAESREAAARSQFDSLVMVAGEQAKRLALEIAQLGRAIEQCNVTIETERQHNIEQQALLRTLIDAYKAAELDLRERLAVANGRIASMRSSPRWKLSPLKKIYHAITGNKPPDYDVVIMPDIVYADTRVSAHDLSPQWHDMPSASLAPPCGSAEYRSPFSMRHAEPWPPAGNNVTTLGELFALNDTDFVRSAYMLVLGREADREGHDHFVWRMREGDSKASIVNSLVRSPEGQAYSADVDGLAALGDAFRRSRWFLIGRFFGNHWGIERDTQALRKIRIVENEIWRFGCATQHRLETVERLLNQLSK